METAIEGLVCDPDRADLRLNGSRYMLIRPETLAALARAAGDGAGAMFFAAGREGGRLAAGSLWEKHAQDPWATVESMLGQGGVIGWARMEAPDWTGRERSLRIEVSSHTLNWPGGAGWELLAGIFSGLGETIFGEPVTVEQVAAAPEAPERLFIIGPSESGG